MRKVSIARVGSPSGMLRAALLIGVTITLAGCYAARPVAEKPVADTYPYDVRQRHPIAIREGERTLEVFVGTNRAGLTPAQRADIAAFAQRWRAEATGGIVIQIPIGTSNEAAALRLAREIEAVAKAVGVPPFLVITRRYRPANPLQLATVRVIYPKMVAEAGPCGLWPQDIGASLGNGDPQNREYWNFGCAQQRNLAAMVENPADLVQPRGDQPAYAARRSVMFDKYRKGEDPSGKYATDKDGKITDVTK